MNDVSLNPEIIELEGELGYEMPQYPVIPNPDGEATADISKMEIDNVIYNVKDAEARAVLPTKVDKENGKGLSTNDYTNEDKAIVGGVTAALATKVDKEAGKGLSTEDYTTEEKSKLFHIQAGAEVNVQADWFESNKYNDAYIKNKPINLSAFNNDVGFVQNTVNNLVNYYTKTQTYTKEEVNALVQPFAQFEVVDVLPTEDISLTTIYLVPKNPAQTDNIYDEYINTDGTSSGWEKIGDTEVDLSNYYTKSEVDTLLSAKANSADLATVATSGNYNDLTGTPTLATVATSGSYNDLTDKPNLSTVATSGDYDDLTNKPVIDTEISPTSTNAVQNKVIYDLLNDLLPEATATGNPIAITNASGLNAKSLKVELEPIQDLNGYDSPWVGGGGKNKLNFDRTEGTPNPTSQTSLDRVMTTTNYYKGLTRNGYYKASYISNFSLSNGTLKFATSMGGYGIGFPIENTFTGQITISAELTNGQIGVGYYDDEWHFLSYEQNPSDSPFTVTPNSSAKYISIVFVAKTTGTETIVVNPQVEIGSSATSYAPYSNICPISGRTQTTVSVNSEDTTIPFNQTVYGGEVDVTSGGTKEDWYYRKDKISDYSAGQSIGDFTRKNLLCENGTATDKNIPAVCDKLPYLLSYSGNQLHFYVDNEASGKARIYIFVPNDIDTNTEVEVAFKLQTPSSTISTPSNEISLLKGANTLVADGDMELVYSKTPQ